MTTTDGRVGWPAVVPIRGWPPLRAFDSGVLSETGVADRLIAGSAGSEAFKFTEDGVAVVGEFVQFAGKRVDKDACGGPESHEPHRR